MASLRSSRRVDVIAFAAAAAVVPASQVLAQSVEEIIVTTRYEEESLQEVPIAVTAIGAEAIERKGINDLFQLADLDPSVSFDTSYGPGDTRVAIRGLSNTRGRSNVAFLVDGVDVTSENQIAAGSGLLANQRLLSDVERIEIVKGPQSALYGRAAFAGAIAYTTKNPTDTLTGTVGVDLAQGNEFQVRGAVSGPIVDGLGFRLDGVSWSSDGRFKNSVSGADLGGGEGWGGSGALRWEPSDTFDIKVRVAYSEDENTPRPIAVPLSDTFIAYPQAAIDAGIGVGNPFFSGENLGLVNHGTFCPDIGVWNDGNPLDPNFANTLPGVAPGTPGICSPGNIGSISDLPNGKNSIRHSETLDGREQAGSTLDLFRTSINANWDIPGGTFTFIGGYTNAEQTDMHDQDYQAFGRPDRIGQNDPFYDYGGTLSVGHLQTDTETETRQISGELRFATNFEGPVNGTVGYLRWDQKVRTLDRNFIGSCQKTAADFTPGSQNVITGLSSIRSATITNNCDGLPALVLFENQVVMGDTVDNWQDYIRQFLVTPATVAIDPRTDLTPGRIPGAFWQSDTRHQSIYLQGTWDITEKLRFTAEARWVDEKFDIQRPNQASCGNISTAFGTPTQFTSLSAWLKEGTGNVPDLNCSSVTGFGALPGTMWAIIEGSESSDFIVPKGTLEWFIDDRKMMYLSYARGQKPGGINQLAAGGSAVTIDELRFEPEKMDTYEIGTKTTWEAAGVLVANGAVFFNDYTDKQVSTQVLVDGVSSPRVTNASGAEVLGVEVDLNWLPSAIDGLTLRLAYTWQDAKYTEFIERSTDPIRAGAAGGCVPIDLDPDPVETDFTCELDLSNNALERQARNALSGNFTYVRPLPGGSDTEWFFEGDTSFTDKRYVDQDNFNYFDSYWLTNFRLGLQTDQWDVLLFLDNAFEDDTIRTGGSGPDFALQNTRLGFTAGLGTNGWFGILPDPRSVGIRTNFRFGS